MDHLMAEKIKAAKYGKLHPKNIFFKYIKVTGENLGFRFGRQKKRELECFYGNFSGLWLDAQGTSTYGSEI